MNIISIDQLRQLAADAPEISVEVPDDALHKAILIREVENQFLDLFAQGRMNGTVHTCVGQEFSAVAVAGQLAPEDWVTSNHRCHGHFIAKTGKWQGLIDELMGYRSGACMGVGSSQHLFATGFLSNGPQAALVPVATGIALHQKSAISGGIAVSFIGEGTFGEGVLYESFNLASLWQVPQLFVCENNLYSQSTPQSSAMAGTISARSAAFDIKYFEADTWHVADLLEIAKQAIRFVRAERKPAMLTVRTYRLNAHSKGDDDRDANEVGHFRRLDPLNRLLAASAQWRTVQGSIRLEIAEYVDARITSFLTADEYICDQLPRKRPEQSREVKNEKVRMVQALNRAYHDAIADGAYMIGEDIVDPYGGAFKVSKGLSTEFPSRVLSTPISESSITGVGIGLSLMGSPTYVEIMFGDFATHVFDQLISNASKFFNMYAFQVSAPVRIRTPMGGKRGYGPTHSQSLEKLMVGIDNVAVFALTSLEDPKSTIAALSTILAPAVLIENKVDYGRYLWQGMAEYTLTKTSPEFGALLVSPRYRRPTVTVVAYGDSAREIADALQELFIEGDSVLELIVPVLLHPFDMHPVLKSLRTTGRLVVVEDGSTAFGIGAEIVAQVAENMPGTRCSRIGAAPVPIPSILSLEKTLLPSIAKLAAVLRDTESRMESAS